MRTHAADAVHGGGGFGDAVEERPHVDEAGLHVEGDVSAGRGCAFGEAAAVVDEDVGGAGEDEQRWERREVLI